MQKVRLLCSPVYTRYKSQICSHMESNTTDKESYDINEEREEEKKPRKTLLLNLHLKITRILD